MTSYRLNRAAFDEHLLNAEWMRQAMHDRADAAKALAETIAPVYEQGPHPGRYKESFDVESGTHGGAHGDRAYAILRNSAPEALAAEFGTGNNDAHHTLVAALDAIHGESYATAQGSNTPRGEA